MDRPPRERNPNLPEPVPRGRRRQHELHAIYRRHGPIRYEPYAHDLENRRRGGRHNQYYQFHWETVNNRWIWLRPVWHDRTRASCIVCDMTLGADIGTIGIHEISQRHTDRMLNFEVPINDRLDHHLTENEFFNEMASVKILLAAWFASEGIPYIKINTLLPLMKRISRHSGVIQELKVSRWTLSKINNKVLAPAYKVELAATLSRTKFSILFDESTGINSDKHGCLLVRFADDRSFKIRTVIWDYIPIYREDDEHSDETAATLYYLIVYSLFGQQLAVEENRQDHVIPRGNLVSSGTDGCNSMVGVHNSVATRLRQNFNGINHITCPCHGSNLCGSHSIQECPVIIQILVDIYNWFCSPKRLHALQQNQIRLNMDIHKILRFVDSRWLTGLPALMRIEEQMPAIDATLAEHPDNVQAVQLLTLIRSPIIRCLIPFFTFILEVVEDINGWMQTEEVILPEMYPRIVADFKDILLCYMERQHVLNANVLLIDTEDEAHFLPYDDMLIGNDARRLAQQLPQDQYIQLMEMIRRYLIRLAAEWIDRLIIPWYRYRSLEGLLMENALSQEYRRVNPELIHDLVILFPRAVPQNVDEATLQRQWNDLIRENLNLDMFVRTDSFWYVVKYIRRAGIYIYRQLADFMLNILTTPHSNAQTERTWSTEKYIKNKYRNLLALLSVRSILQVKDLMKLYGCEKEVHRFQPTAAMIRAVIDRIYDRGPQINIEEMNALDEASSEDDDDEE